MVTRKQIDGARPESVIGMIRSWKTAAADLVSRAETYQNNMRNPGGETWSGATANAAIGAATNDKRAIDNLKTAIDAMADTAIASMSDPVIPNLVDVRAKITAAEAVGFTVNDDLSVTYPATRPPDPKKKEDAERRAEEIGTAATKWWNSDQAVADQINRDKGGLSAELSEGKPNMGRYERLLREAGLLSGPIPEGYYAQWLHNAQEAGIAPDVMVEIARRHGITPEDFDVLNGMKPIEDRDGKTFFLLPEGMSGDDARKAVLMTYILNARTDYAKAGRVPGVTNDFAETPYSADEVQRIIDRQAENSWSYDQDVGFVDMNGGRLVTTPNGMLMGLGGNFIQDMYSVKGGVAWGDIFMVNIDDVDDPAAELTTMVESGRARYEGDNGTYAGALDLDRLLHHEEIHSQHWAREGYIPTIWDAITDIEAMEEEAGLHDGGYK